MNDGGEPMKSILILVLLGGAAWGGYFFYHRQHPEKRACVHFADLCGDGAKSGKNSVAECEQWFSDVQKMGGRDTIEQPSQCLRDATSCGQAVGCMAGAVGR